MKTLDMLRPRKGWNLGWNPGRRTGWNMGAGLRLLAIPAALCLLHGCAVGPVYVKPDVVAPPAYKEAGPRWTPAAPADAQPRGPWWTMFGDPVLDALQARIDADNHDLRAAAARFAEARAQIQGAQAAGAPQLGVGATATRSHVSANVLGRSLAGKTSNDFSLPLTLSWEPDLWGRIGAGVTAAQADAQAAGADMETVRLALHAELAIDYFQLRALDAEKALLSRSIEADESDVRLTQDRLRIGIASALDLEQAQAQLEAARAQRIDLEVARSAAEHALATLTGRAASEFSLPPAPIPASAGTAAAAAAVNPVPAIALLPAIPPGLPSELLQRRPDVAMAERKVAAANARIGVAKAAFYPSLVLGGSGGLESASLAQLVALPSHFWSLGPTLAMALFDGGARAARSAQAQASYDGAVEAYRQRTLVAFQEVEDNLAALRVLAQEATVQARATAAASRSLSLTMDRYRIGTVSYLEVTLAQTAALSAQRQALDIQRR
ncbi:MAG: efflux transporter outer membrane subunit, partial [Burkholderiaceae bacterium]